MNYQEWQHSAFNARAAQLPVVPHADGRRARCASRRCSATRATRCRATCSSAATPSWCGMLNRYRTELGVEALPAELEATAAGDDPAAAGGDGHGRRSSAPQLDRRHAGVRRRRPQPHRPQVSDRLSRRGAPGCTSRCATRRGASVFESGAIDDDRRDCRQRQRRRSARRSSRTTTRSRAPDQVQIYEPILGDRAGVPTTGLLTRHAVPQGQPAAAARLRQGDGRRRDRRLRRGGARRGLSPAAATASATASTCRRPDRSPSTWSCATSRSATAGRTTSRNTTPPSPGGSSATTTRCRRVRHRRRESVRQSSRDTGAVERPSGLSPVRSGRTESGRSPTADRVTFGQRHDRGWYFCRRSTVQPQVAQPGGTYHMKRLVTIGAALLSLSFASLARAQEMPAAYKQVLDRLGRPGLQRQRPEGQHSPERPLDHRRATSRRRRHSVSAAG